VFPKSVHKVKPHLGHVTTCDFQRATKLPENFERHARDGSCGNSLAMHTSRLSCSWPRPAVHNVRTVLQSKRANFVVFKIFCCIQESVATRRPGLLWGGYNTEVLVRWWL